MAKEKAILRHLEKAVTEEEKVTERVTGEASPKEPKVAKEVESLVKGKKALLLLRSTHGGNRTMSVLWKNVPCFLANT